MKSKRICRLLIVALFILFTVAWFQGNRGRAAASNSGRQSDVPTTKAESQETTEKTGSVPMPIVPFVVSYDYMTKYMAQPLDNDADYIGIEAIVIKEGSSPVCTLVLAGKAKSGRVYYTNSEAKAKLLSAMGRTAHFTQITYKVEQSLGEQPNHNFIFKDEKGRSFHWRFIAMAEPNVASKGVAHLSLPLGLVYRAKATAAGEGTAVQIDDKVIEAQSWPEYSQPPYFVAFKGSICVDAIIGGLISGTESWQVKSAPQRVETGAQWTFTDALNNPRQFKVTGKGADEVTIKEAGVNSPLIEPMTLVMKETPQGFSLKSISYSEGSRLLRLTFKPELNVAEVMQSGKKASVAFQIDIGGETKAVEGTINAERKGDMVEMTSRQTSPDWAQKVILQSQVTINTNGYKVTSKSVGASDK